MHVCIYIIAQKWLHLVVTWIPNCVYVWINVCIYVYYRTNKSSLHIHAFTHIHKCATWPYILRSRVSTHTPACTSDVYTICIIHTYIHRGIHGYKYTYKLQHAHVRYACTYLWVLSNRVPHRARGATQLRSAPSTRISTALSCVCVYMCVYVCVCVFATQSARSNTTQKRS
jgi:hypothetical protein